MTLGLQIIRNELQSWKSRNITRRAGPSLSPVLIRCPPCAVPCTEPLLEIHCLPTGFSTFSSPGMAKPFLVEIQGSFGSELPHGFIYDPCKLRQMPRCLSRLLFYPHALACERRNACVCVQEQFCDHFPLPLGVEQVPGPTRWQAAMGPCRSLVPRAGLPGREKSTRGAQPKDGENP